MSSSDFILGWLLIFMQSGQIWNAKHCLCYLVTPSHDGETAMQIIIVDIPELIIKKDYAQH